MMGAENVDKSLFIKVAVDPRETFVEYVHNSGAGLPPWWG